MKKINFLILLAILLGSSQLKAQSMNNNNNNGKTFPASDKVKVERVSFKNRYDITVVADMYYPKDLDSLKNYILFRVQDTWIYVTDWNIFILRN